MRTKFFNSFLAVTICLVTFACNQAQKGQDAMVGDAIETPDVSADATIYNVNTKQSVITWIGSKPTGQHNGTINLSTGSVAVNDGKITGGSITIDIKSLEDKDLEKGSDNYQRLTGHLMSDDFFAANQYSTATFELVEIVPFDSTIRIEDNEQFESEYTPATMSEFMIDNPTHYITGNLTMRGTTKSVKFPAKIQMSGNQLKAEAKFNIDRTDWGLMYGDEASVADKMKDKFIYNTVNVGFSLSALKEDNPS